MGLLTLLPLAISGRLGDADAPPRFGIKLGVPRAADSDSDSDSEPTTSSRPKDSEAPNQSRLQAGPAEGGPPAGDSEAAPGAQVPQAAFLAPAAGADVRQVAHEYPDVLNGPGGRSVQETLTRLAELQHLYFDPYKKRGDVVVETIVPKIVNAVERSRKVAFFWFLRRRSPRLRLSRAGANIVWVETD